MDRRDNNFDVLRLLAAWLVLFSHSYSIGGQRITDSFARYVGIDTFGGVGVTMHSNGPDRCRSFRVCG